MKPKDESVNIWGLEREMQPVLKMADRIWEEYGQELVVTSARDSLHSSGSLHYYGLAVDLRTRDFPENQKKDVKKELELALGSKYDVVLHSSHMHVEFDPKG